MEHRDFEGSEMIQCDTVMTGPCHCTFVQTHQMYGDKSEPFVNYGLQMIMTNNVTDVPLVGDVGHRGGCMGNLCCLLHFAVKLNLL